MTADEMENRIVRYGDLVPCRTAFIDAHTPGSDRKENFTIIGGGVSEAADQHVHIKDTPGLTLVRRGNRQNAEIHCIRIVLPKCSLCYLAAGGFSGVMTVAMARLP